MNRFIRRANQRVSVSGAATLLIAATIIGQLLGFLRVKLINANFSALGPGSTDAYFAAFKIPDFFFMTLAAGALSVAFIPALSDHLERGDKKGAWKIAASLMNLLSIIMVAVAIVIFVFAQPLIHYIVAPNLEPEQLHNAVTIMRLIALNPLLFTLSGILTSVQQTYGRFFFYAIAPIIYNLSIIVSIYLFKNNLGIIGLGIGAATGAVLQLLVATMGMAGIGFKYFPKIFWNNKDFKVVLRNLPARSIDQGIDSINSIAETNFARRLGTGNISYYENAYVLQSAPILLIGTSIATAAFPRLTERLAQGRPDLFRRDFLRVLRAMIWIALPVVVIGYFARGYLARMIFTRDAPEIALIFGFLCAAIFFRVMYAIISRYFYAQKDTWTPLFVSLFTIALNIFLSYNLSKPSAYGVSGLALAQSIVATVEVAILVTIMVIRDRKLFDREFLAAVLRIISVTGFSILAAFIVISFLPLNIGDRGIFVLGSKLFVITLVTFSVHLGISLLFGLDEAKPVVNRIKKFILKPIGVPF